jgi:hypothetical protein
VEEGREGYKSREGAREEEQRARKEEEGTSMNKEA